MKLTKAFVFTVLAAGSVVASGSALAQESATPPTPVSSANEPAPAPRAMFRGPPLDQVAKALNLNDAQKAQVKPILETEYQKMWDIRRDTSLSMEERRRNINQTREATSAKLKPILTPEQYAEWQKIIMPRRPTRTPTPAITNGPGMK